MVINKKLYSVTSVAAILILFFVLVSSTASASITETRITTHGTASMPAIYNNKIVWQDIRDDNEKSDIYMYDLSNKKETKISTTKFTTGGHSSPTIYKNKVVWVGPTTNDDYVFGIYVKDLSTKKQDIIITFTDEISNPKIYGDNIVYSLAMAGGSFPNVYMYNLSSSEIKKISTSDKAKAPDIYGNKIVWYTFNSLDEYDEDNWNIYMYDLSTKKETKIITNGTSSYPAIYDNKIVWQDKRNGNWDIYMYDFSTKKETQITNNKFDQINPDIYGNTIVWQDNRNGNWDIYAYDLKTHQQMHTTDKSDQIAPTIYSNKVVWTDYRNGQNKSDIYMGTISYLPVAAFSASPITGKAPLTVKFTDKSTDAYYWSWNFGDKSTSTFQNPTHKYSKAGKYTVSLIVKNAAGTNTKTINNYITVKTTSVKPVAAFSASPTTGKHPLNVKFTDKSTGSPTSWSWNFGDKSTSTSQNPTHKYTKAGKYTVSLTVKNAVGSTTVKKTSYITVK